jgi:hypothetical protein
MGVPVAVMGAAYFVKRQFREAAANLLLSIQSHLGSPNSYRFLAACYADMSLLDEAHAIIARRRAMTTQVMPSDLHLRNPEDRELFLSGRCPAMGEPT